MKEVLFININIPSGLESISHFEDLIPTPQKIAKEGFNYDNFIHEGISKILKEKNYQIIILPYSLDANNYLNFLGITVGLHIRLTPNLKHHQKPLLFLGPESVEEILKLSDNAHLFMTSGIFHSTINDSKSIVKKVKWIRTNKDSINDDEYQNFISKINLVPPDSQDNRHSIANEWGMYRLNEIAGTQISRLESNLFNNLFFKYLLKKTSTLNLRKKEEKNNKKTFESESQGLKIVGKVDLDNPTKNEENEVVLRPVKEVLIIDDEAEKGWRSIFEKIIENTGVKPTVDISISYQDSINKLLDKEYDLIFLDIRLNDSDHLKQDTRDMSSFKLLSENIREIKSKNFTTPVIILTASNKIWNIDAMINAGADFYYLKEHPEYGMDISFSEENYKRLKENINASFEIKSRRSEAWNIISEINLKAQKAILNKNRRKRLRDKLIIGYGLLIKRPMEYEKSQLLFNQEVLAYIAFWSLLDEIAFEFIEMDYDENKPKSANVKIRGSEDFYIKDGIDDKTGAFFIEKYNIKEKKYEKIKVINDFEKLDDDKKNKAINKELQMYTSEKINCILYYKSTPENYATKSEKLKRLNSYRNKIDFIHPPYEASVKNDIVSDENKSDAFRNCIKLLRLISEDLID